MPLCLLRSPHDRQGCSPPLGRVWQLPAAAPPCRRAQREPAAPEHGSNTLRQSTSLMRTSTNLPAEQ